MDLNPGFQKSSHVSEFELERQRGVTLAWHDLSVYVPNLRKKTSLFRKTEEDKHRAFKQVLHNGMSLLCQVSDESKRICKHS